MEGYPELLAVLGRVRRRWQTLCLLRAARRAGAAACGVLACALLTHWAVQPHGVALILLWGVSVALVVALVAGAALSLASRPRDLQIARLIEERCDEFEDALVTALATGSTADAGPVSAAVVQQAAEQVGSLDLDRVVSRQALRRTAAVAAAALAALTIAMVFSAPPAGQAVRAAGVYIFPERLGLEVRPGDARVVEGQPFRVIARVSSGVPVAPLLRLTVGSAWRDLAMEASADGFTATVDGVDRDFHYVVSAAGTTSAEYAVTVLHPPRVEQIDLHYEYPAAFGMKPRDEEDGGDVYGPAGTRVRMTVRATKPVRAARLALAGGEAIPLTWRADLHALQGDMTIAEDGSYRVVLADTDGLENPGDTEYFIRTLQDGPPDVRITRPATDRQVTPLEEVAIEAQADDDFGVAALDLVYAVAGRADTVVPFTRAGGGIAVTGSRMLYLEDLRVKPGDVVSYYARARDVSRGKRASEARSDIFFLEVKPFEEEFVASQSQGGAGGGNDEQALEDLIQAEKDVITATWNLDRRGRQAGAQSADDIRSVWKAQNDVRTGTARMLADLQQANETRRRRLPLGRGDAAPPDLMAEALGRAVPAMVTAQERLDALKTAEALPAEMTSLNELLRAQAEVRRREIQQQGNGNGGPGGNRQQQDMSSLFDRELARQQQTNYETPGRGENRGEGSPADANADRLQDLARRQDAVNRGDEQLAKSRASMSQEQLKRELERLTREQAELRREVEELAREMQQNAQRGRGQSGRGGRGGAGGSGGRDQDQQASRELQQASEDMQNATSELRRDNPQEAGARGSRAAERLRELEQRLRGEQPDQRRQALGELELESRQMAEAQRRLTNPEAGSGGSPTEREDQARRRAAEQQRLAERAERLEQSVRQLAGDGARGGDPREQEAATRAAQEVDQQRLSQRMRDAARPERQRADGRQEGEQIARGLERLADRLGAAGGQGEASQQLSEELSRLRQLREELETLDRQLAEMKSGGSQGRGQQGKGVQPGGTGQEAGGQQPWNEARELLNELRREDDSLVPPQADGFNPGRSAPGTEEFKQDFARWEELKVQLAAALERSEQTTAERLRQQQSRDRLNAGASQSVPEAYRRLVDRYYRALASGK